MLSTGYPIVLYLLLTEITVALTFLYLQRNRLVNIEFGKLKSSAKKAAPKAKRVNKKPHKK